MYVQRHLAREHGITKGSVEYEVKLIISFYIKLSDEITGIDASV